ncbi:MAG TPA: ribulose-phosphate 3-epimerase [Bryobacteraceae bacterium]|nr:ribulose-phosphate 3-epimerase [Bryobacteraceae bacterium]
MVQIVPSIFAADFARLGEQIRSIEQAGAPMIHVDIMDGHFVPNFTMGTPITESIRKALPRVKMDHHLMIEDPDTYAPIFIKAGADCVSVHYEVARNLDRTLHMIQEHGARAGVVINPATNTSLLDDVLEIADYVLVMSVNPGYGGQKFIPHALDKVRQLDRRRRERGLNFVIEIDGGVDMDNVAEVAKAGVNWVVAGTSVFRTPDPGEAFRVMQRTAEEAISMKV